MPDTKKKTRYEGTIGILVRELARLEKVRIAYLDKLDKIEKQSKEIREFLTLKGIKIPNEK